MKGMILKQTLLLMLIAAILVLMTACSGTRLVVMGYDTSIDPAESDKDLEIKKNNGLYIIQKEYNLKDKKTFTPFVGVDKDEIYIGGSLVW